MADSPLPYLIPFGVALAVGGAVRLVAGPGRVPWAAGLGAFIGFFAAWQWLLAAPWMPYDAATRVAHIALGGALIGLFLDIKQPKRIWAAALAVIFAGVSIWATVAGGLFVDAPVGVGPYLRLAIYGAAWLLVLSRLDVLRPQGPTAPVVLVVLAGGLGLVAALNGDDLPAGVGFALAAAMAGYMLWTWILGLPTGDSFIFGMGGAVVALGMALAEPGGPPAGALALLLLVPFADGTARHIPLGPGPIRTAVYPVALILVAALPVVIAAVISYVNAGV